MIVRSRRLSSGKLLRISYGGSTLQQISELLFAPAPGRKQQLAASEQARKKII
tara:strand:- start:59 stop:217 length:159 start_codon:yes stop_codon:yes gene_type:complete